MIDVRLGFRRLRADRLHTAIHILGLTAGLIAASLALAYVWFESTYDSNLPDVYRAELETAARTPGPLAEALLFESVDVVSAGRVLPTLGDVLISRTPEIRFYEKAFFFVDPSISDVLEYRLVSGSWDGLANSGSVVVTESVARKYFADEDPLGQRLTFDVGMTADFTVIAVMEDPRPDSHLQLEFLASMATFEAFGFLDFDDWRSNMFLTYLRLADPARVEHVTDLARGLMDQADVRMQPVGKIHLAPPLSSDVAILGTATNIRAVAFGGVLVLLLACINYVNLSLAQQLRRSKQLGVIKTLGAGRSATVIQSGTEAGAIALVSAAIAIPLVRLSIPALEGIAGVNLGLRLSAGNLILICLGMALFCVFASMAYPLLIQSRAKAVTLLQQQSGPGRAASRLRNVMVGFQFVIALALVSTVIIIDRQIGAMYEHDSGLPAAEMMVVNARTYGHSKEPLPMDAVVERLREIPGVIGVSAATDAPGSPPRQAYFMPESASLEDFSPDFAFGWVSTDSAAVRSLGMRVLQGTAAALSAPAARIEPVLVNESGLNLIESRFGERWDNPIGKRLHRYQFISGRPRLVGKVVIGGVIADAQFESPRSVVAPMMFKAMRSSFDNILIRFDPSATARVHAETEAVWRALVPERPFDQFYVDDVFRSKFGDEERARTLLAFLAGLCVLVGCIGLFGLSSFSAEQRRCEIAVRKTYGASSVSVFVALSREVMTLIGVALLVAAPITHFMMSRWLSSFPNPGRVDPTIFLITGLAGAVLAVLAVSYHTAVAALRNPVESL